MKLINKLIELQIKKDFSGATVFYPHGQHFGKKVSIVPRTEKILRIFLTLLYILFAIGLALNIAFGETKLTIVISLSFIIIYYVGSYIITVSANSKNKQDS